MNHRITLPLLLASFGAWADTPPPATAPQTPPAGEQCKRAEYHQFDFWIGQWDVYDPDGQKVGSNRIEPILKSCALAEHWTDAQGGMGKSYNGYDAAEGLWHQFWVSENGNPLLLTGGLEGTSMVLSGEQVAKKGGPKATQKITWTPNTDGSVRQHWQASTDGGRTWTTVFDGTYKRAR